jgi:hypothetical protein
MKAVKVLSLAIVGLFLLMAIWVPIASALDLPPAKTTNGPVEIKAETKGADVRLFFRGKGLTPTVPSGNQSEEKVACPGLAWGAKFKGSIIGKWSVTIGGDTTVSGSVSVSIWARSQGGAKSAGFRINMYRSGGNTQSLYTNRQDISANPVKFTATGSYSQQFNTGDTFDVQLVWLSNPQHGVGPSGAGEFLSGNGQFDSSVKVSFNEHPIAVTNITIPTVSAESMDIKAEFRDILNGDPTTYFYGIAITGATTATPDHIDAAKASSQGNMSAVSWTWHHKMDSAKTGVYTISIGISYDGNSTSTNSTQLTIKIPVKGGGGGGSILPSLGIGGKGGSMQTYLILIIVIIVVVVVAVVVVKKKGGKKASKKKRKDEDDEDEEEDDEEEDEEEEEED